MTDAGIREQARQIRRTNRELCDAMAKLSVAVDDGNVALFLSSVQLALVANSAMVSALEDELGRVSGELDFRRSLDGIGDDGKDES